ncbi:polysulfide reductase NrfD [Gemmata sp. G18]|uniref:Polysulfide reductase NrfD n=1 Tax=Gemmata palustris TaxID=2822762 RepID=A0ABS5BMW6_9BACT|nr:NrfD/PsrC family molybdoenzyme membrane anchor subunit [Gemmata palustris]MBP3955028.1 polysulfide reductase NrfD [Gemmata palustris]
MRTKANAPGQGGYANQVITKPPAWHTLVVFDVLFNNLTTGLFLVAAIGELARPAVFEPVATWAYPLALVLLLIDLGTLVLDLGDKLRFHHMLRVFKPSSPMSLGTWCLTIYSLFLTAILAIEFVALLAWLPGDTGLVWWARKFAVVGGIPFCFGSAAYKGVLFSTTAQPGWKDARWLGAYLVNSALWLGAGELLVIAALMGESRAVDLLVTAVGLLAVLNLIVLGLLANDLHPTLAQLYPREERRFAGAVLVLVGVALPIGLLLAGSGVVIASAVLAAVVSANLGVRFVLVRLPHAVTKA